MGWWSGCPDGPIPFSVFAKRDVRETGLLLRGSPRGSDVVSQPRLPLSARASQSHHVSSVATKGKDRRLDTGVRVEMG